MLQNSNLCAESGIDTAEFKSDNASTDDSHLVRNLLQVKSARGADHVLLVKVEPTRGWEFVWFRARSNDDVLSLDRLRTSFVKIYGKLIV